VKAVDVYSVARDVNKQTLMIYQVMMTSRGRLISCDSPTAVRHNDNVFLLVFLLIVLAVYKIDIMMMTMINLALTLPSVH